MSESTPPDPSLPPSSDLVSDFGNEFKAMTLKGFCPRPDKGGVAGRPVDILANVYPMELKKLKSTINHYDVEIVQIELTGAPRIPTGHAASQVARPLSVKLCREIWEKIPAQHAHLVGVFKTTAFDGRKSAFTPSTFPDGEPLIVVLDPLDRTNGRQRRYRVKIELAQQVDMTAIQKWIAGGNGSQAFGDSVAIAIQALDVLLRHDQFLKIGVVPSGQGRKFFNGQGIDIGGAAIVLDGFFQSVRPTTSGLVLNLDTAYSPFRKADNLRDVCFVMVDRLVQGGRRPIDDPFTPQEVRHLDRHLRGTKVQLTHRPTNKEYTVAGFGGPADKQFFTLTARGGAPPPTAVQVAQAAAVDARRPTAPATLAQEISVADYFDRHYNTLRYCRTLQVCQLKSHEFVPLEALKIVRGNGIPPTRLTGEQAAEMIKIAAKLPRDRKTLIDAQRQSIAYDSNERIASWGIQTSSQMLSLKGRLLPPPKVVYNAAGKVKEPRVGSGSWNLVDTRFDTPNRPLKLWGVLCFAPRMNPDDLKAFMDTFVLQMKKLGMFVTNGNPVMDFAQFNFATCFESIRNLARKIVMAPDNKTKAPPQLMVFILPDKTAGMYDTVKRIAMFDLPVAVTTQVLLAEKLRGLRDPRRTEQYCANVAMKVNIKLFGTNWKIAPQDLPKMTAKTIMFGCDVTHPPATRGSESVAQSIAGLVATPDGSWQVRLQDGRQEPVQDLQDMVTISIRKWMAKSKQGLPENIIFFRDGVSEGQYSIVVDHEIRAIKDACRAIDPKAKVKLTYIVAAKRHHVRFFAKDPKDTDKSGNLLPGLVVDQSVTAPYLFDFYLQSQAGLVGTARPTHYVCLLDENSFTSDQLQKLTNSLCYSFARATRSVSLVPVAYYADILCTKARSFIYADDSTSTASGSSTVHQPRYIQDKLERWDAARVNGGPDGLSGQWYM